MNNVDLKSTKYSLSEINMTEKNKSDTKPETAQAANSEAKAEVKKKVKPELSAQELTELLQRTQANFENYRKQVEKRTAEQKEWAAKELVLQLLPVLDNFELAFKNAEQNLVHFKEGMELIYAQLNTLLETNQVKIIETKNQIFDPYLHEALLKVEADQPEGTILEEFQKGFTLHEQVIRHAKVKISAGKKVKENSPDIEDKNIENKNSDAVVDKNEN